MARPFTFLGSGAGDGELTAVVDSLAGHRMLALDTEADAFHRYYEKVCLLQVSTPDLDLIYDPLALGLPDPVRALLTDPARTWVLHGADYDVLSMKRSFGVVFGKVFDTMLAARFLGRPSVGLVAMLAAELGVVVDKKEQRSDWARRPLSDAQLEYARKDTMHLLPLAERLIEALAEKGRLHWVEEECELLRTKDPLPKRFDPEGWKKLEGAKGMSERTRRALRALYLWREEAAKALDRAPFRVMPNESLVAIAGVAGAQGPQKIPGLAGKRGVPRGIDLHELAAIVAREMEVEPPRDERPPQRDAKGRRPQPVPEARDRLTKLRAVRDALAKQLELDPGLLAPSALLEAIARDPPRDLDQLASIPGMSRWRIEVQGSALLEAAQ